MSERMKSKTQVTVNNLLSKYLPGNDLVGKGDKKNKSKSGALEISNIKEQNLNHETNQIQSLKQSRKEKKNKNKKISDSYNQNGEIQKLAVLNQSINDFKTGNKKLTNIKDEQLKEIISKNVKSVKSWELSNKSEIKKLQNQILSLKNKEIAKRREVKAKKIKQQEFNEKVKKNLISVPGLTPGLAPVGASDDEDSSDEEDDNNDFATLHDDYDENL
ncbi:hypothetical protein B5S32_g2256 [[Candida] boidinii]|nr:hypothetical protein B5S32_g2256 [[Candida] boidinii]